MRSVKSTTRHRRVISLIQVSSSFTFHPQSSDSFSYICGSELLMVSWHKRSVMLLQSFRNEIRFFVSCRIQNFKIFYGKLLIFLNAKVSNREDTVLVSCRIIIIIYFFNFYGEFLTFLNAKVSS